jgi:Txe/YoeB family toxin of Txe-Axe toxin-antitoxin module
MSTTRTAPTLGEVAFRNLREQGYGPVRAMKAAADALAIAGALAIAATQQDGFPTQAEYANYWKQSERSAQRDWERFRKAFPGEDGPERLARALVTDYSRRLSHQDPSVAFAMPATVLGLS